MWYVCVFLCDVLILFVCLELVDKESITLWKVTPFEMSLVIKRLDRALTIIKVNKLNIRTKAVRILNNFYVFPNRFGLTKEMYALIPQILDVVVNGCAYDLFNGFDSSLFKRGKDNCWWNLVNKLKGETKKV